MTTVQRRKEQEDSEFALVLVVFGLLCLALSAMFICSGLFYRSLYHRYSDVEFLSTTCYISSIIVARIEEFRYILELSVNYTVNNVTRQQTVYFGELKYHRDAVATAKVIEFSGSVPCFYHPADDKPLIHTPDIAYKYQQAMRNFCVGLFLLVVSVLIFTPMLFLKCW